MKGTKNYLMQIYGILKLSPKYSLCIMGLTIIMGILPSIQTMILAEIFNKMQLGWELRSITVYMLWFIFIMTLDLLMPHVSRYIEIYLQNDLRISYSSNYFEKKCKLPYYLVENKDVRNLTNRIEEQKEGYYQCLFNFLKIGEQIVKLFSCFIVVGLFSWWAAIVMLIGILPITYMSYYFGNKNYKIKVATNQNVRFILNYSRLCRETD